MKMLKIPIEVLQHPVLLHRLAQPASKFEGPLTRRSLAPRPRLPSASLAARLARANEAVRRVRGHCDPCSMARSSSQALTANSCSSALLLYSGPHSLIPLSSTEAVWSLECLRAGLRGVPGELSSAGFTWWRRMPKNLYKNTSITK
jgi:hypothetical protein